MKVKYDEYLVKGETTATELSGLSSLRKMMLDFVRMCLGKYGKVPTTAFLLVREMSEYAIMGCADYQFTPIECTVFGAKDHDDPIQYIMDSVIEDITSMKLNISAFGFVSLAVTGKKYDEKIEEKENSIVITIQHRCFKESRIYSVVENDTRMGKRKKLKLKTVLNYEETTGNMITIVPREVTPEIN